MDRGKPDHGHVGAGDRPPVGSLVQDVEQGLDVDITVTELQREYGAEGVWATVNRFRLLAVLRAGARATHVLLGPSQGAWLETYSVPGAPTEAGSAARRLGTLARFVARLVDHGTLRGDFNPMAPADKRVIQKCAHIAQSLGIRLGYEFDLLENGAFSAELDVDICRLGEGRGGADPFVGSGRATAAFLGLVGGKGTQWLEVATFALHPKSRWRTAAEFAGRRGIIEYDRQVIEDAFDGVGRCLGEMGVRA
ncbi:MAG: hypothetical protein OXU86_08125 [Thaumarchaeota archaeon]|nr:hypothetical protein [Nitrososphaerota archaeon]MDD9808476.1 hypothetical protein [Nitrososphaerota archaeon]MDD9826716.1 hypothetical protein [Nitrososphaerota archaeon]MDD9842302.1 hypothetical protein [Nitrososphaerota archaeon]